MKAAKHLNFRNAAVLVTLVSLAASAQGQATEQWYVTAPGGAAGQRSGHALAVKNDVMAIGAPHDSSIGDEIGAVDVFRWNADANDWLFEQRLLPSDPQLRALFGSSVAVETDVIVVGAPRADSKRGTMAGQVYVYRLDPKQGTWVEEQVLVPTTGAAYDEFGTAVAVSRDAIVAGAIGADTKIGTDSGCAFVFRYGGWPYGWAQEQQLLDPDGAAADNAGYAVDIYGATAAVATCESTEKSIQFAGSVEMWSFDGVSWTAKQELVAPQLQYGAEFGWSIDLAGDLIAVGSPWEDESASIDDSGAAYLFSRVSGKWTFENRFTAVPVKRASGFGTDVAVDRKTLVVGCNLDDWRHQRGAAYLFRHGKPKLGWVFDQKYLASDGADFDDLGTQVDLNERQFFASAEFHATPSGSQWGAVYGYDRDEINLSITPSDPDPAELVTVSAYSGTPGAICVISIDEVDGVPLFLPLVIAPFAADHTLTVTADTPDPLYGVRVGMRAYKVSPTGPLVASELAYADV